MIRDFLDHLAWEVRTAHFEQRSGSETTHPELVDQLTGYSRRYHCVLLAVRALERGEATPEQFQQAAAIMRLYGEEKYARYIEALETLEPLFEEALACAARQQIPIVQYDALDVLRAAGRG
jgi:hypothetical protein